MIRFANTAKFWFLFSFTASGSKVNLRCSEV